jgi:acyl-CoA reductase-like NAD-dependent aldehyde dehydrogenase
MGRAILMMIDDRDPSCFGDRGRCVAQTIGGGDVDQHDEIVQREVFGPVVTVQRFDDPEAAIRWANDIPYGLAASVWTSDPARGYEVAARLDYGNVWINENHAVTCQYPYGGMKQSGLGREMGPRALDEYTEEKFVHLDLSGGLERRVYGVLLSS